MNEIRRTGPPRAIGVWDGRYSFVVRLNEPPAAPWIYRFKLATPVALQYDPERVVVAPERGLLFERRICSPLAILRCSLSVEPGACAEVDESPPRPVVASGDCGLTPRAGQDGAAQSLLAVCRDPRRRQPQTCHRGRIQRQTRQRLQAAPWSACPLLRPNVPSFVPFRCTKGCGGATVFFLLDRFGGASLTAGIASEE